MTAGPGRDLTTNYSAIARATQDMAADHKSQGYHIF
jgi:hypothetical protein